MIITKQIRTPIIILIKERDKYIKNISSQKALLEKTTNRFDCAKLRNNIKAMENVVAQYQKALKTLNGDKS